MFSPFSIWLRLLVCCAVGFLFCQCRQVAGPEGGGGGRGIIWGERDKRDLKDIKDLAGKTEAEDRRAWERVTARMAAAVPADRDGRAIQWRFSVRDAEGINARSRPDGRVDVTSATLPFVANDAELAAVLAHEMAHVYCRHGWQRAMESWAVLVGSAALGMIWSSREHDPGTASAVAGGLFLTVSSTALAARQRDQELEADAVSLDLLRRAGYPPSAAPEFWTRYTSTRSEQKLGKGGWWLPHPPDIIRLRRLRELTAAPENKGAVPNQRRGKTGVK